MSSNGRRWWSKPAAHSPGTASKRVTQRELFYDLVFVVVISQLAHHLYAHPDAGGVRDFLLPECEMQRLQDVGRLGPGFLEGAGHPLIFDTEYQKKLAYDAIYRVLSGK